VTDSILGWLARARTRADRGVTLVDRRERERRLPWPQLVARAEEVAGGLHALDIAPGERVALLFPTGEAFLAAFLGALRAGAVPVPLPPPSRLGHLAEQQRRLAAMLAAATPRLLLADEPLLPLLAALTTAAPPPLAARALAELPSGATLATDVDDDAPGLVQFSSGTTAAPKPVLLSRRALAVQARLLNAFWPDGAETDADGTPLVHRGFSWLPLHHDMGLVGGLLPALERPADLALLPPEAFVARPALWLRGIARTRATVSPAPNFAFAHALRRVRDEELAGVDLSRWRHALCGAEAVSPQTLEAFAGRFARWGLRKQALTAVYGLAEAGLAVTFGALAAPPTVRRFARRPLLAGRAVPDETGREVAGVGLPLPGFAVAVRDEDGRDLAAGRVGSVWVRGPSLMEGYLDDPQATGRALCAGWLDSGDLGFVDERGELFLVGRQKDLVIVRGRNHAPEEIEEAAARVAGVRAGGVAALGWLPERGAEEELLLLVERERGDEVDGTAGIVRACRDAVRAAVGVEPARVSVLAPGALPRTSSGKLRRGEALRRWLAGELAGQGGGGETSSATTC
jgi:acyl-CoA synthetase (AMP-forming)/AMP-acid ligase II